MNRPPGDATSRAAARTLLIIELYSTRFYHYPMQIHPSASLDVASSPSAASQPFARLSAMNVRMQSDKGDGNGEFNVRVERDLCVYRCMSISISIHSDTSGSEYHAHVS